LHKEIVVWGLVGAPGSGWERAGSGDFLIALLSFISLLSFPRLENRRTQCLILPNDVARNQESHGF